MATETEMRPSFEPLADDALLLRLGDRMHAGLTAQARAIASRLREQALPWLRDLVPAYASLAVFFDARQIDHPDPHAYVAGALRALLAAPSAASMDDVEPKEIPVC